MSQPDDPALVEGMLQNCEQEVHELERLVLTLHGQLALKERELQRLLVIQSEQAAEVDRLTDELRKQEAAASV